MGMNPVAKELWLAKLRSGEYKQGKGKLHVKTPEGDEYCCLGVACVVAVEAGVQVDVDSEKFASWADRWVTYNGEVNYLPTVVAEWMGLLEGHRPVGVDVINVELPGFLDTKDRYLSNRNDFGATFEEIANLIEEHL